MRPVAYFPEWKLLLQERAPGVQLLELIKSENPRLPVYTEKAAEWLARLHGMNSEAEPRPIDEAGVRGWITELSQALPEHAAKIRTIGKEVIERREESSGPLVPGHGDFHPLNVFHADSGRVTVIDLDTFSARE